MVRIAFLQILFLIGCGEQLYPRTQAPSLPPYDIDLLVIPIIEEFAQDAIKYGIDVSSDKAKLRIVKFEIPKRNFAGTCVSHPFEGEVYYTEIILDPRYKTDPVTLKGLMYHELGHCLLQKQHTSEQPKTIMSPSLATVCFYEQLWTNLVSNLFTNEAIDYIYKTPCKNSLLIERRSDQWPSWNK
jgi:hypothetical protein